MSAPSPVVMHILSVRCRHCGEEIKVAIPDGKAMSVGELLTHVQTEAHKAHPCPQAPKEQPAE